MSALAVSSLSASSPLSGPFFVCRVLACACMVHGVWIDVSVYLVNAMWGARVTHSGAALR